MDEPLTFNKKKQKETGKYSIVTFDLHKPKGNKYPQFDFAKVQKKLGFNTDDDDGGRFHDNDAREIVRRLEAKYPNKKTKSGKKIRFDEEDFIEKSLGYDVDDDFIDDSEAHDELVPSTLDTKKGGHYVNKGPLEFVSIGAEESDEESEGEEERPRKRKKDEEKAPVRAPKRPDQIKADEAKKADEVKKAIDESKKTSDSIPKKRVAISSSSSDEESGREEPRRVGGPPTLKRSKPSVAAVSSAASSPAQVKKTEERASEPRRMTGAPPNMPRKKTEPVPRPSLAGRPPINSSPVKAPAEIPIETISSEEDEESQPEPSSANGAGPGPSDQMEVDINEVPHPVQLKIVAFESLCQKHHRPGRKQVAEAVVNGAIEIHDLMNRLGMKKGLKGVVMEKLAQMCEYTRAGLESRIKRAAAAAAPTADASTVPTSTASAAIPPSLPVLQQQQQQQKAAPSSSNDSIISISSSSAASTVVSTVAGPSKPNPAVVIGVKPQAAAVPASIQRVGEVKKDAEKMIGKWTASQYQEALKLVPNDQKMLEDLVKQMSYDDFAEIVRKQQGVAARQGAAAPTPAPSTLSAASAASSPSKWEEAKKSWQDVMKRSNPTHWDNVAKIFSAKELIDKFVGYKQSVMRKHPLLGEKAMLHMDIGDNNEYAQYFVVILEFGKIFENNPIYMLAYLDDAMKHFCGSYARTDRLVRHFLKEGKYKEQMDRIRMLPEFTKMGQQFAEKESMLSKTSHHAPSVSAIATNGKSAGMPTGSKPVLKQTQITQPSSMLQQMQQLQQLQQQIQKMPQLAHITPQQLQVILTTVPGTSNQDPTSQNTYIMQLLKVHVAQEQERARKAKEEEERRILIAKAKAEEAEKKRKEKEEAAALKKAQKEEEKRLEKERKQKEAEEEKKRKEEEKNKRIEEERQRRIREEEEKERRRKEEIERKMREEAEKKRFEEEMARKQEEIRIKQEEEKREREKREMEERLREEEERAALMLADEVTMEMEEMEGVPRPLTETEEVEVAEEEERKRERERQVIAAREASMQRQNSMSMSAGLSVVKQENPDKELLDSFFMGSSSSSSQSSTAATVCGPVSSREERETATTAASATSSTTTLNSYNELRGSQGSMSMQTLMMHSPQIPKSRFANGSHYVQPSNPCSPAAFASSPYVSIASPLAAPSHQASPMMNPSPSNPQMIGVCKSESSTGGSGSATPTTSQRHNSFSSPSTSSMTLGSPQMMQQGQPMQPQQQQQAFFPNQQMQSTTNGMHQSHLQSQPVPSQPSMHRQNSHQSFSQQMQQQQQQHIPNMQLQQGMHQNMGNIQWQPALMQQPQQPTPPHLQQQQRLPMMQQQQHSQMRMQQPPQQSQIQMQQQLQNRMQQQQVEALGTRERRLQEIQQKIAEQRQAITAGGGNPDRMMMGGSAQMTNQMGQMFPNQQQLPFQAPQMQQHLHQQQLQQPQPVMTNQMSQMVYAQQNAQMEQQRTQQLSQQNSMNRYM